MTGAKKTVQIHVWRILDPVESTALEMRIAVPIIYGH